MNSILISTISFVIGAILTYIIGPYISERFKLKTELAKIYLAPFRKWCYEFYGELDEFKRRYLDGSYAKISDLQIIVDYRELHETLRYTSRWIGKIEKEDKNVSDNLWKLMEVVDVFWHGLENRYSKELPSTEDVKLFEVHIKNLSEAKRRKIAKEICDHLKLSKQKRTYSKIKILSILKYLRKKIPGGKWWRNL